ncbi:MAG: ThiF family adenylyltransferase [Gammaproteobacteria bacterium]|jgi:molybdopterin/thiamine biosynthesis adenylyltransferase
MPAPQFDYSAAFTRNTGWITQAEQAVLRHKRVAIAGLGGVGGSHLLTLSRLGIGAFTLADFDSFEIANFNRQAGAGVSTLGKKKTDVLVERALDINPELDLKIFPAGVDHDNVDDFLAGADLYMDGLDFFAVQARCQTFAACARNSIPAVTAAPLGMGVALLNFMPGKMTFDAYFQLEGHSEQEQLLRFLLGLSPAMLQGSYLVDPSAVRLAEHQGPSTPMACELCAGVAGTEALKILLGRGDVITAPRGLHFDAYRNRLVRTWRPGGNRHPVQRLGLMLARRRFGNNTVNQALPMTGATVKDRAVLGILDQARWAPSGDNAQPWRFEILDDNQVVIHGNDTREHCVYDLKGHASQLALGTLLETIRIAASQYGLRTEALPRPAQPETHPKLEIEFIHDPDITTSPLLPYITRRSTQRRPLSTRALTSNDRNALEEAAGNDFRVLWLADFPQRLRMARLLFRNGHLRLTLPEAYATHKSIIDWEHDLSEDRIPAKAVGLDPMARRLMRWALASWERVNLLNRYAAGTLVPCMELDFIPGIACAAHFIILAERPPESLDDYLGAGQAVQRFWLTATSRNLQFQPEMTPLIFGAYVRNGVTFTRNEYSKRLAQKLADRLARLAAPEEIANAVFMGRLGAGATPKARSVRLPLEKLLLQP